jgi:predicted DNA-binding ribbon-helix-helix protein
MGRRKLLKDRTTISFALERSDYAILKEIVTKRGGSLSSLIRVLIKNYIKENMPESSTSKLHGSDYPDDHTRPDRVEVKFMRDYEGFTAGSVVFLPASEAEDLISKGICVRLTVAGWERR